SVEITARHRSGHHLDAWGEIAHPAEVDVDLQGRGERDEAAIGAAAAGIVRIKVVTVIPPRIIEAHAETCSGERFALIGEDLKPGFGPNGRACEERVKHRAQG